MSELNLAPLRATPARGASQTGMTITPETIGKLRAATERYGLDNRWVADKYTDEQLAKIYNGLGSDSFPRWLRAVLTDLNPLLEPVAFIHDIEWHEADGSREAFNASNKRWRCNGYRVAQVEFRAWDPRRYLLMNRVRRFGNYCQAFGWNAWRTPSK